MKVVLFLVSEPNWTEANKPSWVSALLMYLCMCLCILNKNILSWVELSWIMYQHLMTSSNGNIFRVTGPLCGEFTGPGEFPTQRPVMRSYDVFFDLRLNKPLSKQPWGWWFETSSWSLWRQCNDFTHIGISQMFTICSVIDVEKSPSVCPFRVNWRLVIVILLAMV